MKGIEKRVNERIRAKEVRLIGPDGKQLGIFSLGEALAQAKEVDMDLVEVAPDAEPPVCRIMDYGRYKYQLKKKQQEAKKRQVQVQLKEIKISPKTEEHDFQFKLRHIRKFLIQKNKTKVSMLFRGRQIVYVSSGMAIMKKIVDGISDIGVVEKEPYLEGRNMVMILAPK
ncbi:MAG TPA: translation initiation factor IF-3 [Syntrophaceae bacterium]|nr:translation initiation factor IF-3 [Syntrophaceae bacterium]